MRKRFLYGTASAIAIFAAAFIATTEADHGHDALSVPECQAYINVLESLDQLYFCRTTAVELNHPDPTDEIGSASAVFILRTAGSIVRTVSLPNPDYALAAVYFAAADVDIPVWNSSTTMLHLSENPALFMSPATSTNTFPEFNLNVGLSETAIEITEDIPKIMLRLESADPTIGAETYVLGTHVNDVGKTLVTDAFEQLGILAIGAFGLPIGDAGGLFTNPPDPAFITGFETTGRVSNWAQSIDNFGIQLGFPYPATVLLVMILLLFFIVFMVWRTSGQTDTIYIWLWPIMLIGSTIGGWPLAATIAVAAISAALAMSMMIQRYFSN